MDQSTAPQVAGKASPKHSKPYPEFPLFPHASGRWCKKVLGKFEYFGKVANDPDGKAALALWQEQREELLNGNRPQPPREGSRTVQYLINHFLTAKQERLDDHKITPRTFADFYSTCQRMIRVLGKSRHLDGLCKDDFKRLRRDIAKTRGPVALGNEISRCRGVFIHAFEEGFIAAPMQYGKSFDKPEHHEVRKARAERGKRMLEAEELQKVIKSTNVTMRAMVLLAINGGLGQTDLSSMPIRALDLKHGWLDFPRPKNGIERRVPLWPETIAAVKAAFAVRREPKNEEDRQLVFLTHCGQRWVKYNQTGTPADALGQEFAKVLTELGIKRPGVSFYAIRHTFRTIADRTKDFPAIDMIMGHADHTMGGRYRERIEDDRLQAVTNHVRTWLYAAEKKTSKRSKKAEPDGIQNGKSQAIVA